MFASSGLATAVEKTWDVEKAYNFYENCIDKEISKCKQKESLLKSSCGNLRKYAEMKNGKAAFLAANKSSLIQEMIEKRVVLRSPRVQAYLNRRYFGAKPVITARPAGLDVEK
jgi:hypothetical protein